jgi:hypothetical protein
MKVPGEPLIARRSTIIKGAGLGVSHHYSLLVLMIQLSE